MVPESDISPIEGEMVDCLQMGDWIITVPDQSIKSIEFAAGEFKRLFEQATGYDLPIVSSIERDQRLIYVGHESDPSESRTELGEEGFRIIIEERQIIITGGAPRGALYGVYQFFEEFLGVRYLTHDHTFFPESREMKIPIGSHEFTPPFRFRWSYYRENAEYPEFATRMRQNTITEEEYLGGKTSQDLINHSIHMLVPFSEYGRDHPEYYALVDGMRDTNTGGGGPQLCVTNPEVVEIATESAIRYLNEHPGKVNISISQADTANYCRCNECESVNQREESPMGAQLQFVNAVAERIEKVYPDVKVGTLAYWYSRKTPKTIHPRPNVQIQLCTNQCCTLHPIDDSSCDKNREFRRDMEEWGSICEDIVVWNYNTNFNSYDLPFPNLRVIGPNLRYFMRNNAKGVFMQANGSGLSGELSDLRNYIISRLLWDPTLDDHLLLEEFISLHYAEAAEPILDYVNMIHDNAEAKVPHMDVFPKPEEVGLDLDVSRRALEYFQRALALANDGAVRARVEKASISAYKAMILTGDDLPREERSRLIERYIALCRKYKMTYEAEWRSSEDYFKELR